MTPDCHRSWSFTLSLFLRTARLHHFHTGEARKGKDGSHLWRCVKKEGVLSTLWASGNRSERPRRCLVLNEHLTVWRWIILKFHFHHLTFQIPHAISKSFRSFQKLFTGRSGVRDQVQRTALMSGLQQHCVHFRLYSGVMLVLWRKPQPIYSFFSP